LKRKILKIIENLNEIHQHFPNGNVITLGNFDGVHLGHRALLEKMLSVSKERRLPSTVVTYFPNPAVVLGKNKNLKNIYPENLKKKFIEEFGPDYLLTIPFTEEFSHTTAFNFMKKILITNLNAKYIIIGYNHSFGKGREGDFSFLYNYSHQIGFEVEKIEPVHAGEDKISSSLIRNYIMEGEVRRAAKLLGRNFSITGEVVKGFQRGRMIGFPTANIIPEIDLLAPKEGVYSGIAVIGNNNYKTMINIGKNPTFNNDRLTVEGYIFDFNQDIYGQNIEYIFIDRIRDEIKFPSVDALVGQLKKDRETVLFS
jgi:riboflavin kinase/FMN adenylyltransferase